jgi:TRAP-type C4-dicarboxylate transport system substrate-binding protein
VAKYVIENEQPYLSTVVVLSKKWLATLPADLQKIVRDDAEKVTTEILPWDKDYFFKQRDVWKGKGGVLVTPSAPDLAAMNAKLASIGDDLSKDNPDLNASVKLVFDAAKRHK